MQFTFPYQAVNSGRFKVQQKTRLNGRVTFGKGTGWTAGCLSSWSVSQSHKRIYCSILPTSLTSQEYQWSLVISTVVTHYHKHPLLQVHVLVVSYYHKTQHHILVGRPQLLTVVSNNLRSFQYQKSPFKLLSQTPPPLTFCIGLSNIVQERQYSTSCAIRLSTHQGGLQTHKYSRQGRQATPGSEAHFFPSVLAWSMLCSGFAIWGGSPRSQARQICLTTQEAGWALSTSPKCIYNLPSSQSMGHRLICLRHGTQPCSCKAS